jgi:hypothetical protein
VGDLGRATVRRGLTAPAGYRWCRGAAGPWHVVRAAELIHRGRPLTTARSVCGLWAALPPATDGWTVVAERATPEPRRMCAACLAALAATQRRERAAVPAPEQRRLL